METRVVNPWTWQDEFGFVQGLEFSGQQRVLVCAGQTSVDEDGPPLHAGDMGAQMNQALDNLETVLRDAGMDLSNVVRLNYYTVDVDAWMQAAGAWGQRMAEAGCRPASTLLGVSRLAFPDLLVEIEATAIA